jgi:hypothetical protein
MTTTTTRTLEGVAGGAITGPALLLAAKLRVAAWDRTLRDPRPAQLATLLAHCKRGAGTEFGRAAGLGKVRTADDYRARVPVRTYADFEPMLERMRRGERNVLHPDFIEHYGCSSGTSSTAARHKYLPISREQIGWQQKAGFDVVARYLALTNDVGFTRGFSLQLMPPAVIKREGPVGITSNPGLMLLNMPRASRRMVLPRPPLRDLENYDRKLDAIADAYLDFDVRALSGTTCWFPNLFDRVLKAARRRGMRADAVRDVWPDLKVLFGGGVRAEPYRAVIAERMGRPVALIDNYNATEGGIFAVTDDLDRPGLRMIPDRGVYFEFVPREDHGRPDARRYALWEVERGAEYSVVVTTCSGLYAYAIGDFVRFTDVFPHRLEFTGRASGVLSVTQELVTFLEIERAVAHALAETRSATVEFACGADVGVDGTARGRYVLFVEFERAPADLARFAAAFDAELQRQNRVYREHRGSDVAIVAPEVIALPRGATRRFMERIGRDGPQQKFPHIVDDDKRDVLRALAAPSH